jgi:hypothetical protein
MEEWFHGYGARMIFRWSEIERGNGDVYTVREESDFFLIKKVIGKLQCYPTKICIIWGLGSPQIVQIFEILKLLNPKHSLYLTVHSVLTVHKK